YEPGAIPDTELLEEIRDVPLHSLPRQEELLRDLGVACPGCDQAHDLALAVGQRPTGCASTPRADAERTQPLIRQRRDGVGTALDRSSRDPHQLANGPPGIRLGQRNAELESD